MGDKYLGKNVITLTQLRQMEVIEISEGKRLGFVSDIIFDDELNGIESLVIPPQGGFFSIFKKKDEIKIRWDQIRVFGVDIVLVDLSNGNSKEINNILNNNEDDEKLL
ncbi:YlmC/YmxH family sporulation protein [Fonticella tunisiensis]|uniref:YlmC/YmxH family sporulation protein n=1 Tax=Fonticella tunisiensis TaxID=1096341 RepID=A0A4R7KSB2_9CLOT|nr:YlmC/YmxH family sporulation protein [Fonticella tunisiensis]TDT61848.1 YlmC/YmxH family sporulation protein [Fonticella tunisiensis]